MLCALPLCHWQQPSRPVAHRDPILSATWLPSRASTDRELASSGLKKEEGSRTWISIPRAPPPSQLPSRPLHGTMNVKCRAAARQVSVGLPWNGAMALKLKGRARGSAPLCCGHHSPFRPVGGVPGATRLRWTHIPLEHRHPCINAEPPSQVFLGPESVHISLVSGTRPAAGQRSPLLSPALPRSRTPLQVAALAALLLLASAVTPAAASGYYYGGSRRLASYGGYYGSRRLAGVDAMAPHMLGGARRLFGSFEPLAVPLPARLGAAGSGRGLTSYYVSLGWGGGAVQGRCPCKDACHKGVPRAGVLPRSSSRCIFKPMANSGACCGQERRMQSNSSTHPLIFRARVPLPLPAVEGPGRAASAGHLGAIPSPPTLRHPPPLCPLVPCSTAAGAWLLWTAT